MKCQHTNNNVQHNVAFRHSLLHQDLLIPAQATHLNPSIGVHPPDSASQAFDKVDARIHFDRSGEKQAVLYEIPYVLNCIEIWRELRVLRQSLESSGFLCFDIYPLTQELFKILHDG